MNLLLFMSHVPLCSPIRAFQSSDLQTLVGQMGDLIWEMNESKRIESRRAFPSTTPHIMILLDVIITVLVMTQTGTIVSIPASPWTNLAALA